MRGLSPSSYTVFLALIALVVLAGTILVYRLRREVDEEDCPVTDDDLLRDFERAYYSGEMDEAEFRSVTAALEAKRTGVPRPLASPPTPADRVPEAVAAEEPVEPRVETDPAPRGQRTIRVGPRVVAALSPSWAEPARPSTGIPGPGR